MRHHYVRMSIRTSTLVNKMVLYSLSALYVCSLSSRCREDQPATIRTCKRRSKDAHVEISSAQSFCSKASFSPTAAVLILLQLRTPPHKRKTRPLLHKLASSLCHSLPFFQFACGAWPSTGRGVDRATRIRSAKI